MSMIPSMISQCFKKYTHTVYDVEAETRPEPDYTLIEPDISEVAVNARLIEEARSNLKAISQTS